MDINNKILLESNHSGISGTNSGTIKTPAGQRNIYRAKTVGESEDSVDEEMVHPDDKIGNAMLKKMKVPQPFKSNKKKQTVSQKKVSENLNFQRGLDPKKALDIGISNFRDYVRRQFEKSSGVTEKEFWEDFHFKLTHGYSKGELVDEILHILEKTSLEYQINYFEDYVNDYIEQKNS